MKGRDSGQGSHVGRVGKPDQPAHCVVGGLWGAPREGQGPWERWPGQRLGRGLRGLAAFLYGAHEGRQLCVIKEDGTVRSPRTLRPHLRPPAVVA